MQTNTIVNQYIYYTQIYWVRTSICRLYHYSAKRDPLQRQKRPTTASKETHYTECVLVYVDCIYTHTHIYTYVGAPRPFWHGPVVHFFGSLEQEGVVIIHVRTFLTRPGRTFLWQPRTCEARPRARGRSYNTRPHRWGSPGGPADEISANFPYPGTKKLVIIHVRIVGARRARWWNFCEFSLSW